jgi:hypothetical protein
MHCCVILGLDAARRWRASKDDRLHMDDFDDDYPDEHEDEPTVTCPYCRREIHEDAQRCPHCEQYISDLDAPTARKPWWIVVGVVVCLYVVFRWIAG